jgi:putative PIN family toxin of toxin-antitoxin system
MRESKNKFRVFVDTNVLISAVLSRESVSHQLIEHLMENHHLMICSHTLTEIFDVMRKRFPDKIPLWDQYFSRLDFKLIYTPSDPTTFSTPYIRDEKDIKILISAILSNPDIVITGDKDFHTEEIREYFAVYTAADFLRDFT